MGILNVKEKKSLLSKNFFFLGTVFVIMLNFIMFNYFNEPIEFDQINNWKNCFDFRNLVIHFLSAFRHSNNHHIILNSLCFLIAGGYIERRCGSIKLLALVFIFALFGESMTVANHTGTGGRGFSGVNYSFYAYIIVDFIFSFKSIKAEKRELVLSIIVLCLIYLASCFCGGTKTFVFAFYPYDLMYNLGHYTGFLSGLILTVVMKICKMESKGKNYGNYC